MKARREIVERTIETFFSFYERGVRSTATGRYDNILHLLSIALHDVGRNSLVVDIGSGVGDRTRMIRKKLGFELIMLDTDVRALKAVNGEELTYPVVGDAFHMPFRDGIADVTLSIGLNEHFPDPERQILIEEMKRVTKRGGKVCIIVPNRCNLLRQLRQRYLKMRGKFLFGYEEDFTPQELKRRMELAGLKGVQCYGSGAFTFFAWPYNDEVRRKLLNRPTPFSTINRLLELLEEHMQVVNKFLGKDICAIGYKQ